MPRRSTLTVLLASAAILLAPAAALAESSSYTYDALGRVITQTDADGTTITFSYDPAGNRTQRVTTAGTKTRPNAANDTLTVSGSTPGSIDPRTNDTDPNGHALSVSGVANGAHGTTSFTSSSVTYTAASGYTGSDVFSYTVTDTDGLASKAYVNVTVNGVAAGTVLFTSSTPGAYSYTVPSGVSAVDIEIWGGGGGGAQAPCCKGAGTRESYGGGGGGYSKVHIVGPSSGTVYSGSIGAGGISLVSGGSNGQSGGATTLTSPAATANGGGGGFGYTSPSAGVGGAASGGSTNISGDNGGIGNIWVGGGAGNGGGVQATKDASGTAPGGGASGTVNGNTTAGASGQVTITAR